jgi:hypothetical protein
MKMMSPSTDAFTAAWIVVYCAPDAPTMRTPASAAGVAKVQANMQRTSLDDTLMWTMVLLRDPRRRLVTTGPE